MADISKIKLPGQEEALNIKDTQARTDLLTKANKVSDAYAGNFASLTSSGDIADSNFSMETISTIGSTDPQDVAELVVNKVSEWSTTTTDTHYPSEKLVKDSLDEKINEPDSEGTNGQVLTTNGSGTRTWTTIDTLPSQAEKAGKYLKTDGSNASWESVDALPSQTGHSGKFLTTDGTDASWANVEALPSQSGQSGKYLTTDGTTASWAAVQSSNTQISTITIAADTLNYTINHTFYTRNVIVQVYDSETYSNALVDITRPTLTSVQIQFGEQLTVGKQFKVLITAMEIIELTTYTITPTLTNITAGASNPTTITTGDTKTLTFTANAGYALPTTVTVTGVASSSWNKSTGTLTLVEPSANVTFSMNGVSCNYLCLTANTGGSTVAMDNMGGEEYLSEVAVQYSTDKITWNNIEFSYDDDETYIAGTTITLTNSGDKVYFRGNNTTLCDTATENWAVKFIMTGSIGASGSVMSLLDNEGLSTNMNGGSFGYLFNECESLTTAPELPATTLSAGCYYSMFDSCTSLITAPTLPATALADDCYTSMFYGCTSLTTAPALPATTLSAGCYYSMFEGCTSLTTPPALPATTLASSCYTRMFYGCTSLTTAPALPATTLAENCYTSMFYNCTSLITAPALPVTTLADYCYQYMFYNCTSLTTPPALPATTLANYCYAYMFYGCTSLITAPALPATTLATYCYNNMFRGCSSLTTAPELPATTLKRSCYRCMFYDCTSLTTPPALPATTLANYCYAYMFYGCTALTTAPALPATALAEDCYSNMFYDCTSLTTAPALPATTLANYCYQYMFYGCTSLTTAPALPATTLANYCYSYMFYNCTSLYVSDASGTGYDKAWTIPTTGTFANTYAQNSMFIGCLGTRSSSNMAGAAGNSYTYYTQNTPV